MLIFKKNFAVVSHAGERKEKDCLNCGTIVVGRYCHVCGQENVVHHDTFLHMVKHFFYDIMHFDSKFFDTLKYLLFRPGFLSKEYIKGRRTRYLNPVKMYVFTSAIFFIIFFSFVNPGGDFKTNFNDTLSVEIRQSLIADLEEKMQLDTSDQLKNLLKSVRDSTKVATISDYVKQGGSTPFTMVNITGSANKFENVAAYDSLQKKLPESERDGWFLRTLKKKEIKLKEKYGSSPETGAKKLMDTFLHKLPYLLFVSLPLFALFFKLLYVRRKEFYYVDHGIFAIHHYIFTFILLLFVFGFQGLADWWGWGVFDALAVILFLSGGFYLYKAMRNFYKQRRAKTIIKFLILNLMGFVSLIVLFAIFVFLSVFEL